MLFGGSLALAGCSSDSGSSAPPTVAVDANLPGIMQSGESAQGTIALSSTVPELIAVDSEDSRQLTIADTSSCNPKITINPSSVTVVVDGDPVVIDFTAPAGSCTHIITISGDGVSTSSNTADIVVISDQVVVTVGLFDTEGAETATVTQGGSLNIKFSPPADWDIGLYTFIRQVPRV